MVVAKRTEQIEGVSLVQMNGRVYDPMIGRFGTPDAMTESPFDTQGWNRYAEAEWLERVSKRQRKASDGTCIVEVRD